MTARPRPRPAILLATVIVLAAPAAVAGNLDPFFLGNEAALTGGAVLAITHEAEAAWYNPAGLGAAEHTSVDISGSAFVLRFRKLPDATEVALGPGDRLSSDLKSVDLLSVPSALVAVRRLGKHITSALGVFVPRQDYTSIKLAVQAPDSGRGFDFAQELELTYQESEYALSLVLAAAVSERVRLGLAVQGGYFSATTEARYWHDARAQPALPGAPRQFLILEFQEEVTAWSLLAKAGLQVEPIDRLHVGLTLRTPTLLLAEQRKANTIVAEGTRAPDGTVIGFDNDQDSPQEEGKPGSMLEPLRVAAGVAWSFPRGWVGAEVDFRPAFDNNGLDIHDRAVWNVRVGGRVRVSKKVTVGAGFFTDRSTVRDALADFPNFKVDFYGLATGLELSTRLGVRDDRKGRDSLVFSSTFALRYAIGRGQASGLVFDLTTTGDPVLFERRDALFQELSLHIGSGIKF